MSKKKIILISSLSVVVLAVIAVVVLAVGGYFSDDKDRRSSGGDSKTTPAPTNPDPFHNVTVDSDILEGEFTFCEFLKKSKDSPQMFYLLDSTPKKDADVVAVYVFNEDGVMVFDRSVIEAKYRDRSIGSILKVDPNDLIKELKEERKSQIDIAIEGLFEMRPELAVAIGLGRIKGLSPEDPDEKLVYKENLRICREEPDVLDYRVVIYTDDSGNNVEKEYLYIPQSWSSNSVIGEDDGCMYGLHFPTDSKKEIYDLLIVADEVASRDRESMLEWKSDYDEVDERWHDYVDQLTKTKDTSFLSLLKVDITRPVSGEIYENSYVGFRVEDQGSLITVCQPETTITTDKPADVAGKEYVLLDPKEEKELDYLYQSIHEVVDASVPMEQQNQVKKYLEKFLDKELAKKLLDDKYYTEAYMLFNYLGLKDEVANSKYERALEMLDWIDPLEPESSYEKAYTYLRDAGREDAITQNMRYRADQLYYRGYYIEAIDLYDKTGDTENAEKVRYEYAKSLMANGSVSKASQLLTEMGKADEIVEMRYELGREAFYNSDYVTAQLLLADLKYKDSEELYRQCSSGGVRDLKGLAVIVGDWWSGDEWEFPYNSAAEEWNREWQEEMMSKHAYSIRRKTIYGWSEQAEMAILSITVNEPLAHVMTFDYRFIGTLMSRDEPLLADVSHLSEFNFSDDKWNKAVVNSMTVGTAIYGFTDYQEPRTGIYFNKDLLETLLGAEWREKPYDLQASGDWTWDAFDALCEQLKKAGDTNNDGVTDIYPLLIQNAVFAEMAMASDNCHAIVTKNAAGKYINNCKNQEIIDDLNWAYSYYQKGYTRAALESEASWNFFEDRWTEQKCVMIAQEQYRAEWFNHEDICSFDWGFVCFPKKSKDSQYQPIAHEYVYAIPNCEATQSIIGDIAFAFNIFTDTPPGYVEGENRWKAPYDSYFKDQRAVNETLYIMLKGPAETFANPAYIIPGLYDNSSGLIQSGIYYQFDGELPPAQLLASMDSEIQAAVDSFNMRVK